MLKMHHIGVVVNDIEKTAKHYLEDIGGFTQSEIFFDEKQGINIQFLYPVDKTGLPVELIQPVSEKNPVANILKKSGVSPYHICYEVDDIKEEYNKLRSGGGRMYRSIFYGSGSRRKNLCFFIS